MSTSPVPAASLLPEGEDVDLYRVLFEAYPDALVVADAGGTIVLANPAASVLLGYSVDELIGLAVEALVPETIRPKHAGYRDSFGRDPRPRPMGKRTDLVARRKDGSQVIVEIALSPLQGRGVPLVVAAIRDIGAYPRIQQALRKAQYSEQLAMLGRVAVDARDPQELLNQVPVLAARALQVDVAVVYLLESNLLELRVASAVGTVPGERLDELIANRPDTSLGFVLAQGRSIIVADYASERRFAVPKSYLDAGLTSALAVPISDRGRTIGILAARSRGPRSFGDDDVRFLESLANLLAGSLQRVRSEEALSHAQRLESVGQLTGGIAHDFNNLLTVIQGNLQVLDELPSMAGDGYARQLVDAASRASRRGAELTSKLLAFSRRQVLQPTAVDVDQLLQSLADMLRRTLDQHIVIEVGSASAVPSALADPGQLEAALLNIAINARDAMPDGGRLRFRAEYRATVPDDIRAEIDAADPPKGGLVAIIVSDDGTGMSAEARERAFEPFFTTKDAGRGTGLGLSTVYGFMKQSKGAVTIDSALGQGTTVTLYIPAAKEATTTSKAPVHRDRDVPPGLRVLLVEDDLQVRAVMHRFLDSMRCKTESAASGEQAMLALAGDATFDLLVTDIALGAGMRGTELAARVQKLCPGMAVLLMSGYSAELLDADRDAPAAWELLHKPCTREELAQAVARALGAA